MSNEDLKPLSEAYVPSLETLASLEMYAIQCMFQMRAATIRAQAAEIERAWKIEKAAEGLVRNAPDVSEDELRRNRVTLSWAGNGQGVFDLRAALTTIKEEE